jgi:isoleucyl-tRNA synthetase
LSFTAEEVWQQLPGDRARSVFHVTWQSFPESAGDSIAWEALMDLRQEVQRRLERLRESGEIGAPLEAQVRIECSPEQAKTLAALGDELRFFLITSAASVVPVAGRETIEIFLNKIDAPKCVRCWHRRDDVGHYAEHPELCGRCVENVSGPGEERRYA